MKELAVPRVNSEHALPSHTKSGRQPKAQFQIKELGKETWPDFERVVEKHNGVWGGCWCTAFHLKRSEEKEWAGKHRALKEKLVRKLDVAPPDWRITCFFIDRDHRKEGVSKAALQGALRIIVGKGGGTVDGYPIDTRGKPYSSSFLWGGTHSMFTKLGFRPLGALGTSKWIMRKVVRSR